MSEIWSDRLSIEFGDLFIDITPDRFAMLPKAEGFAVIPFQIAVGDKRDYLINLLVPFDALEAHEQSLMPPGNIESLK